MLLREAHDRLAADLRRVYGVRLSDMYAGRESVLEVADLVAHLPRGSAVAEWYGGWGALTAEDESLHRIEHVLVAVNSKKPPKLPKPPEGVRERVRKGDRAARMAEMYRKKRSRHGE